VSSELYDRCACRICQDHRSIDQRKHNFEMSKIAEDAAMGIQAFAEKNTLAGGVSNWYTLDVLSTQGKANYTAVCDDIILALNMSFQEGEVFKAVWRKAAARMGNGKPGNTSLYNAQKITHYGKIMELSENPLVKGNE